VNRANARPAVFLDRDGVLIASDVVDGVPVPAVDEPQILPGVVEACGLLRDAGFQLVMVTNQPDIARGKADAVEVARTNEHLRVELGLHDVRMCPHDDVDGCACRKPRPGMLVDAAAARGIDLAASVMVGDRWRDIEAGQAAGVRTVLVDHQYVGKQAKAADVIVSSLIEAVPAILQGASDQGEHL